MPRNRDDELTYYDELGVARDATTEQIRESFRVLARLLHPDQHVDPHLKSVAELQMRKLNRIYAVLADSDRRREYDDYLSEEPGAPRPLLSEQIKAILASRAANRATWVVLTLAIAVVVLRALPDAAQEVVLPNDDRPAAQSARPTSSAPPPSADGSAELAQTRGELRLARLERDAAVRELVILRRAAESGTVPPALDAGRTPIRPEAGGAPALPSLAEPPPSQLPNPSATVAGTQFRPQPPQARLPMRPFNGFWFYVRTAEERRNPGLYPPEFIEATIVEQNGQVRGHYRSRYRIVDRAISPDVNFEFTGAINVTTNTVAANWVGPGGARGELTIKLLNDHSMKVDWSADQLGSIQGLTSGTAALTRRLD